MRLIMLGTGPFAVPTLRAVAANRSHEIAAGRHPARQPIERKRRARFSAPGKNSRFPFGHQRRSTPPTHKHTYAPSRPTCWSFATTAKSCVPKRSPQLGSAASTSTARCCPNTAARHRSNGPSFAAKPETGNSIIQMTPGLDAGPILAQQRTPIDPDEDAAQLEARLAEMGAGLVVGVVEDLQTGTAKPIPQDAAQASKAPRLKKEQGAIDWSRPAQEIKNQVRALRPWPRAYTFLHRDNAEPLRLNIDRVSVYPLPLGEGRVREHFDPGTILDATSRLVIASGDVPLEILELQPAGKRSMPASDFLRGQRIQPGDRFR